MDYKHNNQTFPFGNTLKVKVEDLPSSVGVWEKLTAATIVAVAFAYTASGGTNNGVVEVETSINPSKRQYKFTNKTEHTVKVHPTYNSNDYLDIYH